ncbi:MAG: XRE family transcriptional regulator [Mediterranea massiliensis]|nr:XRE family transcriptional regulator [Mediterranea massiliensis]
MIHIGQLIKIELERQERTPTWLAKKINCDRTNIYRIFNRESIDTALLSRISTALNRNFFEDLSQQQLLWRDKHATT